MVNSVVENWLFTWTLGMFSYGKRDGESTQILFFFLTICLPLGHALFSAYTSLEQVLP